MRIKRLDVNELFIKALMMFVFFFFVLVMYITNIYMYTLLVCFDQYIIRESSSLIYITQSSSQKIDTILDLLPNV